MEKQIYTAQQLDALPVGSVVYGYGWISDPYPVPYRRIEQGWEIDTKRLTTNIDPLPSDQIFARWDIFTVRESE